MVDECPECGARVPMDGECRDNFHSLLAMEWQFPGGVGEVAHFHAVTAYVLQHPDSMGYSNEGLVALQTALTEQLTGQRTLRELRADLRASFDGPTRISAAADESVANWRRESWSMTVDDVLEAAHDADMYRDRVREWATAVKGTIASPNER